MIKRFRQWRQHRQIMKACDKARREVSKMSREEKKALWQSAINRMFPNGWWTCVNDHIVVAHSERCPWCSMKEGDWPEEYVVNPTEPPIFPPHQRMKDRFGFLIPTKESLIQEAKWNEYIEKYRKVLNKSRSL